MPSRDNDGLFLHRAQQLGLVIRVTCNFCRQVRYYDPGDMRLLLGDVEIDGLRRRLKCEECGRPDYMEVEGRNMAASEKEGKVLRRLHSIRIVRRPVWKDVAM